MQTIKRYTSLNVKANSGKVFNVYKGCNNVYENVFTIREVEDLSEVKYYKSKSSVIKFLNQN